MAKPNKSNITSLETALDVILKEYIKDYPQSLIDAISQKAQNLATTIKDTKQKLSNLTVAKTKLDNLKSAFPTCLTHLSSAISTHNNFVKDYGSLDFIPPLNTAEMTSTISSYLTQLQAYAKAIDESHFNNLTLVSNTLEALTSLHDFYVTLAYIPTYITTVFLKTEPNRRKPIIRELYRLFSSLNTNTRFFSLNPNSHNPLLATQLDNVEYNALVKVAEKADTIAKMIKHAR